MTDSTKQKLATSGAAIVLFVAFFLYMAFIIENTEDKQNEQLFNSGYTIEFYTNKPTTVEYGDKIDATDFIKTSKGYVKMPKFSTKKIGVHNLKYTLEVNGKKKYFYKQVIVKDSYAPFIYTKKGVNFTITKGDSLPYSENDFYATDPVDGKLKCKVDGYVNPNEAGVYKVAVSAEDKNGKQSSKTLTITVNEKTKAASISDYSVGESLDAYNTYGHGQYGVRQRMMYLNNTIDDETFNALIHQINLCPQFLVDNVHDIHVNLDDSCANTATVQIINTGTYRLTLNVGSNADQMDDSLALKGMLKIFYSKYELGFDKELQKYYLKESKDKNVSKDDFFADTAAQYIQDKDSLMKDYPKMYNYFEEIEL